MPNSAHPRTPDRTARPPISNRKWAWRLEIQPSPVFSITSKFLIANESAFSPQPVPIAILHSAVADHQPPITRRGPRKSPVGSSTGHRSPVTSHAFLLLIDNRIIRIDPKSLIFIANSISNRQYPGVPHEPARRGESRFTSHEKLAEKQQPWWTTAIPRSPLKTSIGVDAYNPLIHRGLPLPPSTATLEPPLPLSRRCRQSTRAEQALRQGGCDAISKVSGYVGSCGSSGWRDGHAGQSASERWNRRRTRLRSASGLRLRLLRVLPIRLRALRLLRAGVV
jgi:hypothetical protein